MEDSRECEGDDEKKKKDVECQVHTWMMKKGKKAMVYKARKDRRKWERKKEQKNRKRKIISLGHVRRGLMATYHVRILDLSYTKIQYFGPTSN